MKSDICFKFDYILFLLKFMLVLRVKPNTPFSSNMFMLMTELNRTKEEWQGNMISALHLPEVEKEGTVEGSKGSQKKAKIGRTHSLKTFTFYSQNLFPVNNLLVEQSSVSLIIVIIYGCYSTSCELPKL